MRGRASPSHEMQHSKEEGKEVVVSVKREINAIRLNLAYHWLPTCLFCEVGEFPHKIFGGKSDIGNVQVFCSSTQACGSVSGLALQI